ncbi:MAG: tyrosine-type recombinase/integrase [Pseudonocardiaceae bacterium]
MEITHLGLVSYKLPDTGEVVPMLQIVPSKANEERLLLVGPELASVLATIITRLRTDTGGNVPLTTRYDPYERVISPPLPHLIQHRNGWKWDVPSNTTVQKWLTQAVARTGLTDAAGQPLRYTAHDFRRLFTTDAVSSGLPVHIVARLLGHKNLSTTQAYMAVFDEENVRSYRAFLNKRRALRPEAEYREPSQQEWRDFQAHFHARTLELGECGRPYGSTCKHEHSCIRCPSLRLDPRARPRLVEIIANLKDRIQEAKLNGWRGEVAGLEINLREAAQKLVSLDRMRDRQPTSPVNLGIPIITDCSTTP